MGMRAERALLLLADLTKCRLSGDTYQGGMIELELDRLDAIGGYKRPERTVGPAPLSSSQRRSRRMSA